MSFEVIHGDCLEVMAGMEAGSVDAVVCDPPYGLEFMGKEWDRLTGKADVRQPGDANYQTPDNPHGRSKVRYGYGTSMAPMQAWHQDWAEQALTVLKPSHYLLAFGGTRTWHRLACAIEDAGFDIRDTLMWLYGSGFPKGKACLKPAWEPIILARKPGPMRELGIEECRVGTSDAIHKPGPNGGMGGDAWRLAEGRKDRLDAPYEPSPSGRWPANLILDEEAGALLDEQSGIQRDGFHVGRNRDGGEIANRILGGRRKDTNDGGYGGGGGASRFFYCPKASRAERNAGLEGMPERYTARDNGYSDKLSDTKLPRANHHPTVKPLSLMRWLVRLVAREGDLVLDPFTGSGTTGVACVEEGRDFIGIERESEYVEIARRRIDAAAAQTRLPVGRNFVGVELNPEYARMAERRMAPHRDQMQLVTPCHGRAHERGGKDE